MFKVGQKVRCVNSDCFHDKISVGNVYGVSYVSPHGGNIEVCGGLGLNGILFHSERFVAIPEEPQPPATQPQDTFHRPVWIVRGFNGLVEKHSLSAAEKLAKESAIANPGQHFTVMSPVSRYVKNDVQRDVMDYYDSAEEYDDAVSDVPF